MENRTKCRTCLGVKKNVRSIFDAPSQDDYSFAHMITSLTNVKIEKADGITDQICLPCRKKLKDAHDFKLQIERSDAALQSSSSWKKISFNNLDDIKIKVEIEVPKKENNNDEYFKDGETSICYNNTIIKKVKSYDTDIKYEEGPLSVLDFLNTIKDDDENDFNDDYDVDYESISDAADEDYLLPLSKRLKQKKTKKKSNHKKQQPSNQTESKNDRFTPVRIKPIFLSDIRVLPTRDYDKPKIKKKYPTRVQPKSMCNICGKMTHTIKKHLLTHTGERSFKCEKCGKGFLTANDLRTHERYRHITERNFKCDKCIASFTNNEALKNHMLRHSDEKKFVCDICNKGFKRRQVNEEPHCCYQNGRQYHLAKDKEYYKCLQENCSFCTTSGDWGKGAVGHCHIKIKNYFILQKHALRRHKLIHNLANKCIKCDLCNMTFISKYGLKHHLRIHTGERPFNCEICSQPYSYKHDFNRHCFKKHGVFLKRRSVYVMNEEVLKRERELMRDLMLKIHGFVKEGEPLNPFNGPQGYLAFEQAVSALQAKQIPIDYNI